MGRAIYYEFREYTPNNARYSHEIPKTVISYGYQKIGINNCWVIVSLCVKTSTKMTKTYQSLRKIQPNQPVIRTIDDPIMARYT